MKVFVAFDKEHILSRIVKTTDDSFVPDSELEEVTNPDLAGVLQVHQFKLVGGEILPMSEEEIHRLHNERFILTPPLDKSKTTIV